MLRIALIILISFSLCEGAGNETVNPMPPNSPNLFYPNAQQMWKQELPAILSKYVSKDFVVSGGIHGPSATCISSPLAMEAFTTSGNRITTSGSGPQGLISINYGDPNIGGNCQQDVCWVVGSSSDAATLPNSNYQRSGQSNFYVNCSADAEPQQPPDTAKLMKVILNSGQITQVDDLRRPSSFRLFGVFDITDPLYGYVEGTDIGPAIRKSIAAAKSQGSRAVYIPAGVYLLDSNVQLDHVDLVGVGWSPPTAEGDPRSGTWLHIKNTTFIPIEIITNGVSVKNIAFDHDQPPPSVGWVPKAYPYTIQLTARCCEPATLYSTDTNLENLFFYRATKGINQVSVDDFSVAGRIILKHINGQFFDVAVRMEFVTDTSKFMDMHLWPYWSQDANVIKYMETTLIGFTLFRTDSLFMNDVFGFAGHIGIGAFSSSRGAMGIAGVNVGFDNYVIGLYSEQAGGNSQFVNFRQAGNPALAEFTNSSGIFINGTGGLFDFVNYFAVVNGAACATIRGTNNIVNLSNVRCSGFGYGVPGSAGIDMQGSGNTGNISGFQEFYNAHGGPSYLGPFVPNMFPSGAWFDRSTEFFASLLAGLPSIVFALNNTLIQWVPSSNAFRLSSGNVYNTGGVKRYLCINDGLLTVGTTCP